MRSREWGDVLRVAEKHAQAEMCRLMLSSAPQIFGFGELGIGHPQQAGESSILLEGECSLPKAGMHGCFAFSSAVIWKWIPR